MGHLGDFGTEGEEVDATFGWFGATMRVNPDLSDLAFLELVDAMSLSEDGASAVQAVKAMGEVLVHPDDVGEFWRRAKAHRQTMTDIGQLAAQIIGALAGRPTGLPSVSSGGQQPTGTNSTGGSSSQVLNRLEQQGRPDLAVAVLRLQETA